MIIAEFTEKQPQYRYMKIDDTYADVFIYQFVEKNICQNKDDSQEVYLYDINIFRVKQDDITEDMISSNPIDYLNYITNKEKTKEEQLEELLERQNLTEQAVQDLILMTLGG